MFHFNHDKFHIARERTERERWLMSRKTKILQNSLLDFIINFLTQPKISTVLSFSRWTNMHEWKTNLSDYFVICDMKSLEKSSLRLRERMSQSIMRLIEQFFELDSNKTNPMTTLCFLHDLFCLVGVLLRFILFAVRQMMWRERYREMVRRSCVNVETSRHLNQHSSFK